MLKYSIIVVSVVVFLLQEQCAAIGYHYDEYGGRIRGSSVRVGPVVPPTNGQPWPKPQSVQEIGGEPLLFSPALFNFQSTGLNCDILDEALRRYYQIILKTNGVKAEDAELHRKRHQHQHKSLSKSEQKRNNVVELTEPRAGYLDVLQVEVRSSCEDWPYHNMDESYEIAVISSPSLPGRGILTSRTVWGALRGLETFSQIIHYNENRTSLQINNVNIIDFPRFPYRSLLLDSSRHFLPKQMIFDNLDLMAMNKLNIMHWHLSDNEAFPFRSDKFPNLSAKGSYHQFSHEYTKQEVREIIDYARVRGIRIIPEFDTPGHTQSWGLGQPGFLTTCYDNETDLPNGKFGHLDPTNEANYIFLREFFQEVVETFPENFIHLGGDEVDDACWKSNPNVRAFMEANDFGDDYTLLQDYHMRRMGEIIKQVQGSRNMTTIGWQEVWFNNQAADPDMIIHIWILEELYEQIENVTEAGYKVLLGSCWYLDHISYGADWHKYYACDPHNFTGTDQQKALVLGGGPNMWAEMIDATNIIPLLWPRAAVPAERLWSAQHVNDTAEAAPRLEEHRCRLLRRGYNAQPPNGAGFCLGET